MKPLESSLGDVKTFTIPLKWNRDSFDPTGFNLLFTVKKDPGTEADSAALFQKSTGAGITTSGTSAIVAMARADTYREADEYPAPNNLAFQADPGTYYWDIQAQSIATGDVMTVADGALELSRDVSRAAEATIPILSTDTPAIHTTLQANIDAEAVTRGDADTVLQANIDAEATARADADTTLQANIDAEEAARSSTDGILAGSISAEANARISGDTAVERSTDPNGAITGSFVGQLCRVGASSPYTWYRWNGSAWVALPRYVDGTFTATTDNPATKTLPAATASLGDVADVLANLINHLKTNKLV